eukprot:GILI01011081.1.p1 GENE.GILI01011081.1~~GILI01011081.1.p1  ORF type:complete len:286 (+),score=33.46 GILI01011081.1:84-941(+)
MASVADSAGESDQDGVRRLEMERILLVEIFDGPIEGSVIEIDARGATIGRHNTNTVVVPEANISRFHCEVTNENGVFKLKDKGSTTGTFFFLKPFARFPLFKQAMVRVGESEFVVTNMVTASTAAAASEDRTLVLSDSVAGSDRFASTGSLLQISFYTGPMKGVSVNVGQGGLTIGRRNNNQLVIPQDGTVSGNHCKVEFFDDQFFLTDLGSCNGTCLRLSPEKQESGWIPIEDSDTFGAGCSKFNCHLKHRPRLLRPISGAGPSMAVPAVAPSSFLLTSRQESS